MKKDDIYLKGAPLSEKTFQEPPRELGVLPFWFWNGDMKTGEMRRQAAQYKEKGLAGLFIHPRFGLEVPFLSKQWMDKCGFAAREVDKLGMQVWIYDEYNWPSGTAWKKVPNKYPDLQQRYLELNVMNVDGPTFIFLEGYDSRYIRISEGQGRPIGAYAIPAAQWGGVITDVIDLTQNLAFEKVISWQAPPGKWKILYFMEKRAPWYIDALNPESTRRFIEIGYDSYAQALPELMGSVVKGFYTDEPAMHYYAVGQDNYIIPWTADMFRLFREYNGYDLKPWLPALYADMGEKTAKVRYDFWSALSKRYEQAYYRQLRDWCNSKGMLFIGHLLFEEYLRRAARCSGNLFWMLRNLDIIGTDHLYPKIGTPENPDEHVSLKTASSAAHHFGSARVLCESLGGTYWDCTMARMKWVADWEYVLGINLFNPHGFHYSIADERKRDWPPSQFYHHPWWKHYKLFADYMLRLSYMLSGGRHVAKIAILYPLSTIWANYTPQEADPASRLCEADFNYLTDTLLRIHFDYDYIEEEVLSKAKVVNGKLKVRDEEYDMLLLPPITHIQESTLRKIEQLTAAGGKILACSLLPTETTGGKKIASRIQALLGIDPEKELAKWRELKKSRAAVERITKNLPGGGKVTFLRSAGLHRVKKNEELRRALHTLITPDVEIDDSEVFYLHRVKDGRDIYFLVNTAWKAKQIRLRLYNEGAPQRWNPEDGSTQPIYHCAPIKGGVEIPLQLEPLETALIVLVRGKESIAVTEANVCVESAGKGEIIASGRPGREARLKVQANGKSKPLAAPARDLLPELAIDNWQLKPEDDNGLVLNDWRLQVEGEEAAGWVPVRPGIWEPQFPLERKSASYPVLLRYQTRFNCGYLPKNLRLLLDGLRGSYEIRLNGQLVKGKTRRSKLDVNIRELPISDYLKEGENLLEISLKVKSASGGLLDPARLVGDFSAANKSKVPTIMEPVSTAKTGSLVDQGYPYFSGTIAYLAEFNLPKEYLQDRKLLLQADCGTDTLEVQVNGKSAGTRPWAPYSVDITPYVKAGKNRISVKITNTVTNLLEGNTLDFGLRKPVKITAFNRYRFSTSV